MVVGFCVLTANRVLLKRSNGLVGCHIWLHSYIGVVCGLARTGVIHRLSIGLGIKPRIVRWLVIGLAIKRGVIICQFELAIGEGELKLIG